MTRLYLYSEDRIRYFLARFVEKIDTFTTIV